MSDEQEVWQQMEGEPNRFYTRFLLYLHVGHTRSLRKAIEAEYVALDMIDPTYTTKSDKKRQKGVPTSWLEASQVWNWRERAEAYDAHEQKRIQAQRQAYVDSIMQEGYALTHERVKALGTMAGVIESSMQDPDTKEYNPKWIDSEKLREWRGMLDDIAKELGQRVKVTKSELTGKDGGPVETEHTQVVFYVPKVRPLEEDA